MGKLYLVSVKDGKASEPKLITSGWLVAYGVAFFTLAFVVTLAIRMFAFRGL